MRGRGARTACSWIVQHLLPSRPLHWRLTRNTYTMGEREREEGGWSGCVWKRRREVEGWGRGGGNEIGGRRRRRRVVLPQSGKIREDNHPTTNEAELWSGTQI